MTGVQKSFKLVSEEERNNKKVAGGRGEGHICVTFLSRSTRMVEEANYSRMEECRMDSDEA